jgi:hypothetical protein
MLHPSAQDPAAQKKSVELEPIGFGPVQNDTDQTIVSKSISHSNRQTCAGFPLQKLSDFAGRAPESGEIELIGSKRQLRDPTELILSGFSNLDANHKARDEVV